MQENQFTDKDIAMITIDGETKIVPVVRMSVNTPYFDGHLKAKVSKSLTCDLVIGNFPGASDRPDLEWCTSNVVDAVMIRAQSKQAEEPAKALKISLPSCDKELNVEMLKKARKAKRK